MSYSFPTEEKTISNYIYDTLSSEEPELMLQYGLQPFSMRVQSLNRTLIDKIFAVCDYYLLGRAARNSRHLYDIYKLASHVTIDSSFKDLVQEVREHRNTLGAHIALSASDDINISILAQQIYEKDFYKTDYHEATLNLISDHLSYETAIEFYINFVKQLF